MDSFQDFTSLGNLGSFNNLHMYSNNQTLTNVDNSSGFFGPDVEEDDEIMLKEFYSLDNHYNNSLIQRQK
jgi:hypothetical protein